jgi:hypothetical protein
MLPHESAGMTAGVGAAITEARHVPLTDEELRELVTLWPTNGFTNRQTVAPPAMGNTHEGNAPPLGGTVAAQSSQTFRRQSAKAAAVEAETKDQGKAAATGRRQPVLTASLEGCYSRARRSSRTLRARPDNALHEIRFRGVRRDVEPLVAGLVENVPADTDARLEVETIGAAIRALPGVERDHNARTVRMILRDIFDHRGNTTQVAKPQRKTNHTSQSQMSTLSRFIVRVLRG